MVELANSLWLVRNSPGVVLLVLTSLLVIDGTNFINFIENVVFCYLAHFLFSFTVNLYALILFMMLWDPNALWSSVLALIYEVEDALSIPVISYPIVELFTSDPLSIAIELLLQLIANSLGDIQLLPVPLVGISDSSLVSIGALQLEVEFTGSLWLYGIGSPAIVLLWSSVLVLLALGLVISYALLISLNPVLVLSITIGLSEVSAGPDVVDLHPGVSLNSPRLGFALGLEVPLTKVALRLVEPELESVISLGILGITVLFAIELADF